MLDATAMQMLDSLSVFGTGRVGDWAPVLLFFSDPRGGLEVRGHTAAAHMGV